MVERDIFEVANQLHGYIDEGTPGGLARFLRREGDEACNLAKQIAALKAENERQAADIAEFMRRLGPRWFLDQNWFPESVEASDGL